MAENDEKQPETAEPVILDTAISLITKAEIDMQIATARAFPRSISKFMKDVMSMATVTTEIAESCVYALPRGNKTVRGPSVRLAEMVASAYGNLRTGARVIFNDGRHVTAQGITHDLEKNIMHTEEVRRSIMQHEWEADPSRQGKNRKTGKMITMNEDMQTVTGRAACAIAYRNSIFKVVPAALIEDVLEKINEIVRGDIKTLGERRKKAIKYFVDLGIKEAEIFAAIEVKGEEEIDLDKFALLRGMCSAHRNGEAQLDMIFQLAVDQKTKADNATNATAAKLNKKATANAAQDTTNKMGETLGSGSEPS